MAKKAKYSIEISTAEAEFLWKAYINNDGSSDYREELADSLKTFAEYNGDATITIIRKDD